MAQGRSICPAGVDVYSPRLPSQPIAQMPQLPTDAVPAANFLLRNLYRSIDVTAGSRYFAVSEAVGVGGDAWFWNDDNAKVLELLSRPEVRSEEHTSELQSPYV